MISSWSNQELPGKPISTWFNQEIRPEVPGCTSKMRNHQTKNRNQNQENEKFEYQEPKPGTLFLVGSWLRAEDFGFGRTLGG